MKLNPAPPRRALPASALWFLGTLVVIAALTAIGPQEKSLGSNVRVVYLHGVWVWASLAAFVAAGVCGALGILTSRASLHRWSGALGRTGLIFWISYLPISLWAMQANWNGLYLAEPRFRLAVIFSVTGLLLQAGVAILGNPSLVSVGNLLYIITLMVALRTTQNVMHPPAPILQSDAPRIQLFFGLLLAFTLLAAWQVARWLYARDRHAQEFQAAAGALQLPER